MTTINAEQFEDICDRVWRDRVSVLRGSGTLSGEAALMRAVYWRLRKAGINTKGCLDTSGSASVLIAYRLVVLQILKPSSRPAFDGTPFLSALINRYQNQGGDAVRV